MEAKIKAFDAVVESRKWRGTTSRKLELYEHQRAVAPSPEGSERVFNTAENPSGKGLSAVEFSIPSL